MVVLIITIALNEIVTPNCFYCCIRALDTTYSVLKFDLGVIEHGQQHGIDGRSRYNEFEGAAQQGRLNN